ncbi:MAG: hypothetical protein Q4F00_09030 [bacterium]|nr:hypothetical protein [bacterium]
MDGVNFNANNINSFYTAQLNNAKKIFESFSVNGQETAQTSVFNNDGATLSLGAKSGIGLAQPCYGVFTQPHIQPGDGGGCGGGVEVGPRLMYGVFTPDPIKIEPGDGSIGRPGGEVGRMMYGVFTPDPIKPEPGDGSIGRPGGEVGRMMYGVFTPDPIKPEPGDGGKIQDPGVSVCMYGVFAPGGCTTPVQQPKQPELPQMPGFGVTPGQPGAGGTAQPIQPDMSAIMEMTRKSTESMRQMFGISNSASNNMAAMANDQTSDYQSAVALTKLAQSGGLNIDDLRSKYENGELSGMTGKIAEQIINGTFPGIMPQQ